MKSADRARRDAKRGAFADIYIFTAAALLTLAHQLRKRRLPRMIRKEKIAWIKIWNILGIFLYTCVIVAICAALWRQ